MEESFANLGMLKSLADGFLATVMFYMSAWAPYHTAFRAAAAAIIIPAGLVWVAVQTVKLPQDKTASAVGAFVLLGFLVLLLSPRKDIGNMFNGAQLPSKVAISEGAYWSFTIPANVYSLFLSALNSVDGDASGRNAALSIAYDSNTKNVASKWDGSPLQVAYTDYVTKCTAATMNSTGSADDIRALGHVGLHSGSGIGYTEEDAAGLLAGVKSYWSGFKGFTSDDDSPITKILGWTPQGLAARHGAGLVEAANKIAGASTLASQTEKGKEQLAKIEEPDNPFNNVTKQTPNGYAIPTAKYWLNKWGTQSSVEGPEFINAETYNGGAYRNPDIVEGSAASGQNTNLYPENCLEAYEIANLGVAEYRKALLQTSQFAGKMADYTSHAVVSELGELQNANRRRAEAKLTESDIVGYNSAAIKKDRGLEQRVSDAGQAAYLASQNVGAAIAEWLLQVKMPFFISSLAMVCAALITAFPLFVILSLFLGPGILLSYIKLIVFTFLVVLLNQVFMSMGANLVAMTNLMESVYKIGNIARDNQGLEFSAATAKVVIFTSLMAIEVVIAKMLIWDDVKGLNLSPGESGSAAFATGMSVIKGAAAIATAGVGLKAKMATKAASSTLNTTLKTLNTTLQSQGGGNGGGLGGSVNSSVRSAAAAHSWSNGGSANGSAGAAQHGPKANAPTSATTRGTTNLNPPKPPAPPAPPKA